VFRSLAVSLSLAAASLTAAAHAASTVELTDVHICCRGCAVAIEKSLSKMENVKPSIDQENGTVSLTAENDESLQKAVDAIAKAGFHGKIDEKSKVQFAEAKLPEGKITRLEIAHIHNCCPACTKAIKAAVAEVEGVQGDSLKPKATKFVVEGEFEAKDVIAAIEAAGFHATLPKAKK
jgi:copper chaperone CopZ